MNRRQELLETALALFSEQGVDRASMRELARRAGVNVAAAYHHFDSKRALPRAVFEEPGSLDEIRARLEPEVLSLLRSAPRDEAIARIVQVSLGRMEANAAYYGLLHAEVLRGDPDARAGSLEMWERWGAQLEDVVAGAGLVDGDDDIRELAQLRTLIWGPFNEWRVIGDPGETERNERVRRLARFLDSGRN